VDYCCVVSSSKFFPYLWQEGGEILVERDGRLVPAFNGEAGVRALQFLVDRVQAGIDPQTQTFWGDDFAQKKWAVYPHGNWAGSESRFPGTTPRERQQTIAVLPLPVSEPGRVPVTLAGGWIMTVPAVIPSKAPERFERAQAVLQAFLRADVMTEYYGALARVPVRAGVDNAVLAEKIEFFDFYAKMASVARVRPAIPQWSQVADAIFQAMSAAVFQGVDPKTALDQAAQQVERMTTPRRRTPKAGTQGEGSTALTREGGSSPSPFSFGARSASGGSPTGSSCPCWRCWSPSPSSRSSGTFG